MRANMADAADAPATQTVSSGRKKASKPKPKTSPSHPKVSEMVNAAITSLKERGGSSLQAIKKHIASSYKVDMEKLSPFIKKYLKNAVASGTLIQTKGKGATGSFRLSASTGKPKEAPAKAKKAPSAPKKAKAAPAKKPAAKPKTAKKPAAAAKKAKPKAAKSPKKAKATKPKAPKPKKAKTPAKKAAGKKGKK